jgi:hypothetical protein
MRQKNQRNVIIVYVFKRNDDYKSIALPTELQGRQQ